MIDQQANKHDASTVFESHSDLIHWLNQRYKVEWARAERLQAELDDIRKSKAWRLLSWLRNLKRKLTSLPRGDRKNSDWAPKYLDLSHVDATGKVSIVIPFRDRWSLLRNLLQSLRATTYRSFEVVLVDNGSTCPRVYRCLKRLERKRRFRVVRAPGPFHFSQLCNQGAQAAKGAYLLFLNNDMEVLSPDWLEQLLLLAQNPQVGVAGATLLYPDGTIQHAGVFPTDETGKWTHVYRGFPGDYRGKEGELLRVREVPAVSGACLLIRRDLFRDVGGFSEQFPVTGNDVDLCCRVRKCGLAVGVTPHARLLHYESLSRGYAVDDAKVVFENR